MDKPLRQVQCKPCWGGHAGICPDCKSSTLITCEPCVVKCGCGAQWFATWWRYGDGIINTKQMT
mgnify:CR=1 FL=1